MPDSVYGESLVAPDGRLPTTLGVARKQCTNPCSRNRRNSATPYLINPGGYYNVSVRNLPMRRYAGPVANENVGRYVRQRCGPGFVTRKDAMFIR